jgi:hypothetical protein
MAGSPFLCLVLATYLPSFFYSHYIACSLLFIYSFIHLVNKHGAHTHMASTILDIIEKIGAKAVIILGLMNFNLSRKDIQCINHINICVRATKEGQVWPSHL